MNQPANTLFGVVTSRRGTIAAVVENIIPLLAGDEFARAVY
jgi:hypothetical protein